MLTADLRTRMATWLCLVMACFLTACASVPNPDVIAGVADPYENWNRKVFAMNDAIDGAVIKPVASGYKTVVPEPVRTCIGNIFSNVGDVFNAANNLLQGKFKEAGSDVCRIAINSTIGLFGCFDVASELGFEKHQEDFGQTLAVWGVGAGPYIVLPFFGPSTVRDGAAFAVELYLDPWGYIKPIRLRNGIRVARVIDKRSQLLEATDLADGAALDKYSFYRDAYLQRRRYLVYDGDPPDEPLPKYEDEPSQPNAMNERLERAEADQVALSQDASTSTVKIASGALMTVLPKLQQGPLRTEASSLIDN